MKGYYTYGRQRSSLRSNLKWGNLSGIQPGDSQPSDGKEEVEQAEEIRH